MGLEDCRKPGQRIPDLPIKKSKEVTSKTIFFLYASLNHSFDMYRGIIFKCFDFVYYIAHALLLFS